jgi:hypothetical protein
VAIQACSRKWGLAVLIISRDRRPPSVRGAAGRGGRAGALHGVTSLVAAAPRAGRRSNYDRAVAKRTSSPTATGAASAPVVMGGDQMIAMRDTGAWLPLVAGGSGGAVSDMRGPAAGARPLLRLPGGTTLSSLPAGAAGTTLAKAVN